MNFRQKKKTGAEDVEYTIDDKDFEKRYEGKLGKSGEYKNLATPTASNTKKDEVAMKSINAKLATAISSKVSGGGGFKSTSVTKQPASNASKEP